MSLPDPSPQRGACIWQPDPSEPKSQMTQFREWVADRRNIPLPDYASLQAWSISNLSDFWADFYDYFEIESAVPYSRVLSEGVMPDVSWFDSAEVNFAAHMLRDKGFDPNSVAIHASNEAGVTRKITRAELSNQVRDFAAYLASQGVGKDSRVAAYLTNTPEAVVAFLACAALGATWTSVSPDFGIDATLNRFEAFQPNVLITVDNYVFGGKLFDRRDAVNAILSDLPSIGTVVHVPSSKATTNPFNCPSISWDDAISAGSDAPFKYASVPFAHPLLAAFSSGTTGKPKGILHGHGGLTLEAFKMNALHGDMGPGDVYTFFTTTGWMVWFMVIGALGTGAAIGLYDGNPLIDEAAPFWKFTETSGTTVLGVSSAFVANRIQVGDTPNDRFDLSALRMVIFGASPAAPENMEWAAQNIGHGALMVTASGGTDIYTCFVGFCPDVPSYAGEFQCAWLGTDAVSMSDQGDVLDCEIGELIIRQPMPSMPIGFLDDPDKSRLRAAYFEDFPGMWRQGDLFLTHGDGTSRILGRSDATLNRGGVRIGTAEIYDVVEANPDVEDCLVVNVEDGDRSTMLLFLQIAEGCALTTELQANLVKRLRAEASPRHVPDQMLAVSAIPYTISGKKLEVPVKRILMGADAETAANRGAMRDPAALDAIIDVARAQMLREAT
ncbi:acetoacetate--CoA ligase [Octadecabacter sp.]|nr:acetoacetate--CoA ligase [Octadecabacter sp.]